MKSKKKRVYNPYTKKYYELKQRNIEKKKKGHIEELWEQPKDERKKSIWDLSQN